MYIYTYVYILGPYSGSIFWDLGFWVTSGAGEPGWGGRKRTISAAERAKGASVRTRDRSLCTPQSECSNNIKPRPRRFSQDEGARRGRRLGNELYTHTHV